VNYERNEKGARFFETQCSVTYHWLCTMDSVREYFVYQRNFMRTISTAVF